MTFLATLIIVTLLVLALKKPLARIAPLFYALALALDVAYLFFRFLAPYNPLVFAALTFMQRGLIAISLFVIVMFIGALSPTNRLRTWLYPIRAELSLLACLFALGHMLGYLSSYLMTIVSGSGVLPANALISLLVSLVLLVLLLVLGITTVPIIRRNMNPVTWKTLQKAAYVFFGLIYLHLVLMLAPGVWKGVTDSIVTVAAYTAVFGSYLVLRLRRARSRHQEVSLLAEYAETD